MVSKNQLKLIKSLHQKKYRNKHQLFFVEGIKTVNELLKSGLQPHLVVSTEGLRNAIAFNDIVGIAPQELKSISALHTPSGVLGVFEIPSPGTLDFKDWVLALDAVQDPGNLGTIIRLCDWFGITQLVCSEGTVDRYNPKALQATMGSIARVNVHYTNLATLLKEQNLPIFGAFMDGNRVYQEVFPKKGVLVLGNEANGISAQIEQLVSTKIGIPQFGAQATESLNVATATAILLSELRRPR